MRFEPITDPVQMPAPNAYWGRKYGSKTKEGGMFRLKKWAANYNGNSNSKPKHYTRILVENAMARGWFNGRRIKGGTNVVTPQ